MDIYSIMNLETYAKVAIVFGIAISCILAGIVLSYSLANVFQIYDIGEDIAWALTDKDEIKQQMINSSSYISFIDRFPDYRNKISGVDHEIRVVIEAINPLTMNSLELILWYDVNKPIIREEVICKSLNGNNLRNTVYESAFTDIFITETDCLDDDYKFLSFGEKYIQRNSEW